MSVYETPEEGNHRYQRQLATALADVLGLDDGLKAAQSNGWEGVLDVLLGKRPVTSRRHVVGSTIVETEPCHHRQDSPVEMALDPRPAPNIAGAARAEAPANLPARRAAGCPVMATSRPRVTHFGMSA